MNPIIETNELTHSGILRIYSEKETIIMDPDYQRNGEIWTLEKKQLFIDSILNDYDIPKLYLHQLKNTDKKNKVYAVIDGRQRLETVWGFIEGEFSLESDFQYLKDKNIKAGGLTYNDLAKEYPKLKIDFDTFNLPITIVRTDDEELIDDMFYRLNEAVSLNAAEKRNAYGGNVVKAINAISAVDFFKNRVKFSNKRYQHKEVAIRLLFLAYSIQFTDRLFDTKKSYLDKFTTDYKSQNEKMISSIRKQCIDVLNDMSQIFIKDDPLLSAQSYISIYFLLFWYAKERGKLNKLTRNGFINFRESLKKNRLVAENGIAEANFELLEFDRLSQQGTNDASSIIARLRTLSSFFNMKIDLYEEMEEN